MHMQLCEVLRLELASLVCGGACNVGGYASCRAGLNSVAAILPCQDLNVES